MINYARDHSTEDALDYVRIWNASMLQQDEIQESMRAAKERAAGTTSTCPPRTREWRTLLMNESQRQATATLDFQQHGT